MVNGEQHPLNGKERKGEVHQLIKLRWITAAVHSFVCKWFLYIACSTHSSIVAKHIRRACVWLEKDIYYTMHGIEHPRFLTWNRIVVIILSARRIMKRQQLQRTRNVCRRPFNRMCAAWWRWNILEISHSVHINGFLLCHRTRCYMVLVLWVMGRRK